MKGLLVCEGTDSVLGMTDSSVKLPQFCHNFPTQVCTPNRKSFLIGHCTHTLKTFPLFIAQLWLGLPHHLALHASSNVILHGYMTLDCGQRTTITCTAHTPSQTTQYCHLEQGAILGGELAAQLCAFLHFMQPNCQF